MPLSFPSSPTNGQTYTSGSRTWTWNGTTWEVISTPTGVASITSSEIVTGAVTAEKLASNAVTADKIAANAITHSKLDSGLSAVTICTSSTRPASPFTGQMIFETDNSGLWTWNGSAWVSIGLRPPLAPTSLSAVPATTSVAISFTAGSSPAMTISNYEYRLSTNGGSTYGSWTALSPADGVSPITISGLSMNTSYTVQIRAVNEMGAGIASSSVSFTTGAELAVQYLVVAGGGGGGANGGAGAGAGGYRTNVTGATSGGGASAEAALVIATGTHTVTVGGGGSGANSGAKGTNGSNSVFSTITSTGGGAGGTNRSTAGDQNGNNGGSGGGASNNASVGNPGSGTAGQGYGGGTIQTDLVSYGHCGGGGGAGGAGANGPTQTGGSGVNSSIDGTATTRGGGGGGGSSGSSGNGGSGGSGGGGAGTRNNGGSGSAGTANTGGGGGGGGGANGTGGAGGAGIVIVRYLTADANGVTVTGGTKTTSGSYTVHTFTSSSSLVIA